MGKLCLPFSCSENNIIVTRKVGDCTAGLKELCHGHYNVIETATIHGSTTWVCGYALWLCLQLPVTFYADGGA